jgi:MFS family permease
MVGTIRPVVYRERQILNWIIAANLHILGNIIGAALTGFILSALGHWLIPWTGARWALMLALLAALSIAYALDAIGILRLPYPQRAKQVPESWRGIFHPYITSLLYGIGLGTGITTRIATGALYVVLAGLFFYAHPIFGVIVFALFGFARGVSVFLSGWVMRDLKNGEELHPALQNLMNQENTVHLLGGIVLATFGSYWLGTVLLHLV